MTDEPKVERLVTAGLTGKMMVTDSGTGKHRAAVATLAYRLGRYGFTPDELAGAIRSVTFVPSEDDPHDFWLLFKLDDGIEHRVEVQVA